jgi:hypothetical protein
MGIFQRQRRREFTAVARSKLRDPAENEPVGQGLEVNVIGEHADQHVGFDTVIESVAA